MQWPLLNSEMSSSSMTCSWPTMMRLSCCLMLVKPSLSLRTDSRSSLRKSSVGPWWVCVIPWSLIEVSWSGEGKNESGSPKRQRGVCFARAGASGGSALVDRQGGLVQLHDGQVAGRHVDRPDHAGGPAVVAPAAVGGLGPLELLEDRLAVLAPGQQLVAPRRGEQLLERVVAEHVDHLGVIVVGVLVVAHAPAVPRDGQGVLAVLEPLLDQLAVVVAEAEAAADGGGGEGGPAVAATAAEGEAVLDAALVVG